MKSFIVTSEGIALYLDGKSFSADKSHLNYSKIVEAIKAEAWDDIPSLINVANAVQQFATGSAVTVDTDAGVVSYRGEMLRGYIVDRMLTMMTDGFNIKPMTAYLENLLQNPSKRAVDELHGFNEYGQMPITEDGFFIAYKRISGWHDTHTRKVLNKPASLLTPPEFDSLPYTVNGVTVELVNGNLTVSMPRNRVDDVSENTCSHGLHFCSQEYLKSFSGDKIVVLKINPADVVSIPTDYNNTKGRCSKYQVIDVLSEEEFNKAMKVDVFGTPVYDTGTGWDEDDDGLDMDMVDDSADTIPNINESDDEAAAADFVTGYVAGYAAGRTHKWVPVTASGDYVSGYESGYKDGKGHKSKRFK